jgi:hypothetical protein
MQLHDLREPGIFCIEDRDPPVLGRFGIFGLFVLVLLGVEGDQPVVLGKGKDLLALVRRDRERSCAPRSDTVRASA